jgi:hypothetical protein
MLEIKQTPPEWATVADRYATRFLALKDGYTHFKHITHRTIFTRNRTPGNHKNIRKTNYAGYATKRGKTPRTWDNAGSFKRSSAELTGLTRQSTKFAQH